MSTAIWHPTKDLELRDTRPAAHIVKVGVQPDERLYQFGAQPAVSHPNPYAEIDQTRSLQENIEGLCRVWQIADGVASRLALRFTDERDAFVTDDNRSLLRNGNILSLSASPAAWCESLLAALSTARRGADAKSDNDFLVALRSLAKFISDAAFGREFIRQNGFEIFGCLKDDSCRNADVSLLLYALSHVLEQSLVSWHALDEQLVTRIADLASGRSKHEDSRSLTAALSILDSLVANSATGAAVVRRCAPFEALIRHLENSNGSVQHNALALINTMFATQAPSERAQTAAVSLHHLLSSPPVRNAINTNILKRSRAAVDSELAHQLGVLQKLLLNFQFQNRALLAFGNTTSDEDTEKLAELRSSVFEFSESLSPAQRRRAAPSQQPGVAQQLRKLGFPTPNNAGADLAEAPPGMLALDCMLYFAKTDADLFTRIVLEYAMRSSYACPFGQVSIELCKLLIDVLHMSEAPRAREAFREMFFTTERPLEALFVAAVRLLYKTWREMKASAEDVDKVIPVVREQLCRGLAAQTGTFERFQEQLNRWTYAEIQDVWNRDRLLKEESDLKTQPIIELRERLRPHMLKLVTENRLNALKIGQRFQRAPKGKQSREKSKDWFWKLSANSKVLQYADCDDSQVGCSKFEETKQRLAVSDVTGIKLAKAWFSTKETKSKKAPSQLAFVILVEGQEEPFQLVALDEDALNVWMDGLSVLRGEPMPSKQAAEELDMLLTMEVKIRLLDLQGVRIPTSAPEIPPLPENFDFVCA